MLVKNILLFISNYSNKFCSGKSKFENERIFKKAIYNNELNLLFNFHKKKLISMFRALIRNHAGYV